MPSHQLLMYNYQNKFIDTAQIYVDSSPHLVTLRLENDDIREVVGQRFTLSALSMSLR